jgi:hypothetical protein
MKPKTVGRVTDGLYRPDSAQNLCHGFPVGLPITTASGDRPVETLSNGDLIVTRNGGLTRLEDIQVVTHVARAIRFAAGSLGGSSPKEDLLLPADQPVMIRDRLALALFGQTQAVTVAGQLVDDEVITDLGPQRLVLFRLTFDRPRLIRAGGLELGASQDASLPRRAVA